MKIIFKSLIILLFIAIPSQSEVIKEIKVTGNKRVSYETIKIFTEVKLNSNLNSSELNNVIKNLYSTQYFKDVSINVENNILYIYVEENPIIEQIEIRGFSRKITTKVYRFTSSLLNK